MEVKKSKKAEIETKRSTWLLLGFVSVLACMFVAFEWTEREKKFDLSQMYNNQVFEEILIPITMPDQPAPPPPPKEATPEILTLVPDDVDEPETTIKSSEGLPDEGVDIKYVAAPEPEIIDEPEITREWAEVMPAFPGGQQELMRYLSKNIKYPTISQENNVQGRVIVQFVVDKDGSIIDPVIVKSIDPYLDKEAVRVIMSMPKWKPGYQGAKAVRVKYTVPVTFRLQ